MYCTRCGTRNAKTSKFCRECGRKLEPGISPPRMEEEQAVDQPVDTAKVGDLLSQAFQKYEGGDMDEALKLGHEAVRMDSQSTSAHSLLGMVYVRQGDRRAAIRHYERVRFLNPKSAADREKLEELRREERAESGVLTFEERVNSLITGLRTFLAGSHPWPVVVGATVVSFFLLFFLWPKPAPQPPREARPPAARQLAQAPPLGAARAPRPESGGGDLQFIGGGPTAETPSQPPAPPARPMSPLSTLTPTPRPAVSPRSGGARITDLPPITIVPRPAPEQRPTSILRPPARTEAPPSEGTIRIERSPAPSRAQTLENQATSLQISGQYDQAIAVWRQALSGARYTGKIYQQIATCYKNLGRRSDAADSYRDAIKAYQQQIAAGHNVDEAQRGMRTCELGLRVAQREGG